MLIKQKFLFSQDFFADDFDIKLTGNIDNLTLEVKTAVTGWTF